MPTATSRLRQDGPTVPVASTVGERFAHQARQHGGAVAIQEGTRSISYAALDMEANRIGQALGEQADAGGQIALLFSRRIPAIAAMLAALKLGRAYVPLDPDYPAARTELMLADSQASILLTDGPCDSQARELAGDPLMVINVEELDRRTASSAPDVQVAPDVTAYILYTSGSTGRPKGVIQTQENLLHHVGNYIRALHLVPDDRVTLFYSLSFSASLMDIYGALLTGAALLPFDIKRQGLAPLAEWLRRERITVYHSVPTVFRNLLAGQPADARFPSIRAIDLGGEPVYRQDLELFRRHCEPSCTLVNHLAFTEASVAAQCLLRPDTPCEGPLVPVGEDAPGVRIHLLDEQGRTVPVGETGEMTVESRYLSPGYWRQSELTAAAFSPSPFDPECRVYRSGDLGRRLSDGRLEHLGRRGDRVKVRGHSIEVAEIEQALLAHVAVREAAVVARGDTSGGQQLVAYVVLRPEVAFDERTLRDALRRALPDYMLPARFVALSALPLTATGKVDRRNLPAPSESVVVAVAPTSSVEAALQDIWQLALGRPGIGPNDDFFELGGDSILAFRMLLDVELALGRRLLPSVLIEAPTIAELACRIVVQSDSAPDRSCLVALQPRGSKRPLFLVPPAAKTVLLFRDLARRLPEDRPVWTFQHQGLDGRSEPHDRVEDMAAHYVAALRDEQPRGPYCLGGMCFGGIVALEMALQLQDSGERVASLVVLDTRFPPRLREAAENHSPRSPHFLRRVWGHVRQGTLAQAVGGRMKSPPRTPAVVTAAVEDEGVDAVMRAHTAARERYEARRFEGRITLFHTIGTEGHASVLDRWSRLATDGIDPVAIPGEHRPGADSFIREPRVAELARALAERLSERSVAGARNLRAARKLWTPIGRSPSR